MGSALTPFVWADNLVQSSALLVAEFWPIMPLRTRSTFWLDG